MKVGGFVLGYVIIVLLDLFAMYYYPGARLITKPLILASLIIWYINSVKERQRPIILLALIFSLFGDVLLLFGGEHFFIAGVGAFLVAQICYFLYFRKFGNLSHKRDKLKAALVIITAIIFYLILYPKLGSMKIPVLLYTIALATMVIYASIQKLSPLIAIGSLLFMISDMSLGLQKFMLNQNVLDLLIMVTYSAAQYLITKGIIDGQTKA
jgi:uncharacterized membrane protein YhhN